MYICIAQKTWVSGWVRGRAVPSGPAQISHFLSICTCTILLYSIPFYLFYSILFLFYFYYINGNLDVGATAIWRRENKSSTGADSPGFADPLIAIIAISSCNSY